MIHLYLAAKSPVKAAFEQAVRSDRLTSVKRHYPKKADIPKRADLVLQARGAKTKGSPDSLVYWFAARKGALLVCLPEADEYLDQRVERAINNNTQLVILDQALRSVIF